MKRENLIAYMAEPALLDQSSLSEVEELIQTFPYFQTAHMLLARNHHNLDSLKFHDMLRSAAAFAGDRTVLYHLIHNEKTNEPVQVELDESNDLSGRLSDILKRETSGDELVMPPAYSVEDIPEDSDIQETVPNIPEVEQIPESQIDEYTFTGWFDHMHEAPKESEPGQQGLIDKFLRESPSIRQDPDKKPDGTDRSIASGQDDDTPMTEILAKIYAKQGKFKKAIYAYEKLSLKYPEKSTYFATQINRLKSNLEEN